MKTKPSMGLMPLALLLIAGCTAVPGASEGALPASALPAASTTVVVEPTVATPHGSGREGCTASDLGALKDDGYIRSDQQRGRAPLTPLTSFGEVVDGVGSIQGVSYQPLAPRETPTLPLSLAMSQPAGDIIALIYSPKPLADGASRLDLYANGGLMVLQQPAELPDGKTVFDSTERNRWLFRVDAHDAALIWGDEVASGVRPFGLYWSDGERSWSIVGTQGPDILIDMARSIYCG